jgi:hypothetical protein
LLRRERTIYAFVNENGRRYTQLINKVLPGSIETNPSSVFQLSANLNQEAQNPRALSVPVGAIIGGIIAVGALIGCTAWIIQRDENRRTKKVIATDTPPQAPGQANTHQSGHYASGNHDDPAGQ